MSKLLCGGKAVKTEVRIVLSVIVMALAFGLYRLANPPEEPWPAPLLPPATEDTFIVHSYGQSTNQWISVTPADDSGLLQATASGGGAWTVRCPKEAEK